MQFVAKWLYLVERFYILLNMEKQVLEYRIIIKPEKYPDGTKVYVAYCPTLGISDYGDSVEEVMDSIKEGILLAVECMDKQQEEIPADDLSHQIITSTAVRVPAKFSVSYC